MISKPDSMPFLKAERRCRRTLVFMPVSQPIPYRAIRANRRLMEPETILHRILRRRWRNLPWTWERKKPRA
jgi:hypothetical protein